MPVLLLTINAFLFLVQERGRNTKKEEVLRVKIVISKIGFSKLLCLYNDHFAITVRVDFEKCPSVELDKERKFDIGHGMCLWDNRIGGS